VDNNYLDLGMNKSGFVHTLPSSRLNRDYYDDDKVFIACISIIHGRDITVIKIEVMQWLQRNRSCRCTYISRSVPEYLEAHLQIN
jgi:hypothetical protein